MGVVRGEPSSRVVRRGRERGRAEDMVTSTGLSRCICGREKMRIPCEAQYMWATSFLG